MARRRPRYLYRNAEERERVEREFERRYGGGRSETGESPREIYGATVGKVAREQAAHEPGGVKVEHVPGHISFSREGDREWVRSHEAFVHAHPHPHGHHGGRCDGACRKGVRAHKHRRGSSRRG